MSAVKGRTPARSGFCNRSNPPDSHGRCHKADCPCPCHVVVAVDPASSAEDAAVVVAYVDPAGVAPPRLCHPAPVVSSPARDRVAAFVEAYAARAGATRSGHGDVIAATHVPDQGTRFLTVGDLAELLTPTTEE